MCLPEQPQDGGPAFAPNIKDMEATLLEAHKKVGMGEK